MDVNFGSIGFKLNLREKDKTAISADEYWEKNGVDRELAKRSSEYNPRGTLGETNKFLNTLTEEELDKLTFIDTGGKKMVGTWRQAKELNTVKLALYERAVELTRLMKDVNDESDPLVAEYKNVQRLATAVTRNLDHALALAKSYLHGLREPKDSITLSADALKKLFDDARAAPPERPEPGTA